MIYKNSRLPAAVIFDMDGVLADTEPLHAESFVRVFADMDIPLTVEQYRQSVTIGAMNTMQLYASLGGDMAKWEDVSKAKAEAFKPIIYEKGELLPGVMELLQSLKQAQTPTALATSAGRRSMNIILDRFNLRSYFDSIVTWQDVQTEKPDPAAFLLTAERLSVLACECVVMEDSPRGVLAASRAGMKCIAVPTPSTADGDFSPATVVVNSLADVDLDTLRDMFGTTGQ